MPNVEMCKKVYDYITEHPDQHDQESFQNACGTTRCIAGWAAYFEGYRPISGDYGRAWSRDGDGRTPPEDIGRSVLGLSLEEADRIFYEMDESIAAAQLGVHAGVVRREDVDRMRGKRDAERDRGEGFDFRESFVRNESDEYIAAYIAAMDQ